MFESNDASLKIALTLQKNTNFILYLGSDFIYFRV